MADTVVCNLAVIENYNIGLQIASIFIVLTAALLGTVLPVLTEKVLEKRKRMASMSLFKAFGGGVILSTSLVHMLGPSMEIFGNPCIPASFKTYPSWAAIFALIGILLSQLLRSVGAHSHADLDDDIDVLANQQSQVYFLELGILIHSVIIGFSLGTLGGEEQLAFLVAVCFHQFFEGTAMSAIIVDQFINQKAVSIVLILCYIVSTPIGIALGIVARLSHQNESSMLLTQGILEALAAGILLYDSLIAIISPLFSSRIYTAGSKTFRGCSILVLWLGVGFMCVVGNWA
jgi:zinc transporter 1/2/3